MPKLKHETRRGPGEYVLVNGAKLELDKDGCVNATVDQATKLLQGGKWRDPEHWDAQGERPVATPPIAPSGARRPRTQAEMRAAAEDAGMAPPPAPPPPVPPPAAPASQPEVIDVHAGMSKTELLEAASRVGLQLDSKLKKSEILEQIEQHAQ